MLPPAATLNLHQQTQETDQLRGLVRLRRKEEEEMNYRYRAKPYIFGTADIHRITFLGRSNWWCSATAGNPNNTLTSRHYRAKLKKGLIRNSGLNHQDQCPKKHTSYNPICKGIWLPFKSGEVGFVCLFSGLVLLVLFGFCLVGCFGEDGIYYYYCYFFYYYY